MGDGYAIDLGAGILQIVTVVGHSDIHKINRICRGIIAELDAVFDRQGSIFLN